MSDPALQSFVDKWLAVQPAQRFALGFVEPDKRVGDMALAALEQELVAAAYGIREPQVAAVKLNWWAEELAGAAASGGRHPLTRALFEDARAERVSPAQWLAPVQAAMTLAEAGTAADFAAQLREAEAFHGQIAKLEVAWWFGPQAFVERASRMASLGHLLWQTARLDQAVEHDRLPLPMARLARHGLTRQSLAQAGEARSAALRDQLSDIAAAYAEAWRMPGPLSVFRGLEARVGARLARSGSRAAEPMQRVQAGLASPGGPRAVFGGWAAAREARKARV